MTPSAAVAGTLAAIACAAAAARLIGPASAPTRRVDSPPIHRRRSISRPVACAVWTVIATATALLVGPAVTVVIGGVALVATASRGRRAERARRAAIELAMPDTIELLVMSLHAGYSPTQAVTRLALDAPEPVRPAFVAVEQRMHRGHAVADALGDLTTSCGRCALPLVNAMGAAVRDGLPLAPVLDRLTDEANASRRRQGEAAARRLPVRLSFPLVVCTLPSFVLLAIAPAVLGALSTLRGTTP
jgi:Flp pilus assembly protein TadB